MKLLLIEDNKSLTASLKDLLAREFDITATQSGKHGIELAKSGGHDVILLDLGLPDASGLDVCKSIRKHGVDTPLIILTAMDEAVSKVRLLRAGADDYLTKPFHAEELRARLDTVLRRGRTDPDSPHLLKIDGLVLDPVRRHVTREGKTVDLRRKEFDILEYLLRNRDKVVSRPMIIDNVWDGSGDSWNNTVDVHIKYLRDKVDRPFEQKLIQTVYGLGYTIKDMG